MGYLTSMIVLMIVFLIYNIIRKRLEKKQSYQNYQKFKSIKKTLKILSRKNSFITFSTKEKNIYNLSIYDFKGNCYAEQIKINLEENQIITNKSTDFDLLKKSLKKRFIIGFNAERDMKYIRKYILDSEQKIYCFSLRRLFIDYLLIFNNISDEAKNYIRNIRDFDEFINSDNIDNKLNLKNNDFENISQVIDKIVNSKEKIKIFT